MPFIKCKLLQPLDFFFQSLKPDVFVILIDGLFP